MKFTFYIMTALVGCFLGNISPATAQCNPDVTAPNATFQLNVRKYLAPTGTATIMAKELLANSFDNCTPIADLDFRIELAPGGSNAIPPTTTSLDFTTIGSKAVRVWLGDQAGNWKKFSGSFFVHDCKTPNSLACNSNVTVILDANNSATLTPATILLDAGIYCTTGYEYKIEIGVPPIVPNSALQTPSIAVGLADVGVYQMYVAAYDTTLKAACWGMITIVPHFNCTGDLTPPTAICKTGLTANIISPTLQGWISAETVNNNSTDNCTPQPVLQYFIEKGSTPSGTAPTASAVTFPFSQVGTNQPVVLWVKDSEGNFGTCNTTVEITSCNASTTIACNDMVQVSLDQNNQATLDYTAIMEGWNLCGSHAYLMDLAPLDGVYTPTITLDTTHFMDTIPVAIAAFEPGNPVPVSVCWGNVWVNKAEWWCGIDLAAPFAVSVLMPSVTLDANGVGFLTAAQVDNGSYDRCTPVSFQIQKLDGSLNPIGAAADTLFFTTADLNINANTGVRMIKFIVSDQNGNLNYTFNEVLIIGANCVSDVIPPTAICKSSIAKNGASGMVIVKATDINNGSFDNCQLSSSPFRIEAGTVPSATPPATTQLSFPGNNFGSHPVILWVQDWTGNYATCQSNLEILPCMESDDIYCKTAVTVNTSPNSTFGHIKSDSLLDQSSLEICSNWVPVMFEVGGNGSTATSLFKIAGTYPIGVISKDLSFNPPANMDTCYTTVTVVDTVPCTPNLSLACNDLVLVSLDANQIATVTTNELLAGAVCNNANWTHLIDLEPFDNVYAPTGQLNSSHVGDTIQYKVGLFATGNPVPVNTCWGHILTSANVSCMDAFDLHCKPTATVNTNPNSPIAEIKGSPLLDSTFGVPCSSWFPFVYEVDVNTISSSQIRTAGVYEIGVVAVGLPGGGTGDTCFTTVTVVESPNCIPGILDCYDQVTTILNATTGTINLGFYDLVDGIYCHDDWTYKLDFQPFDGILTDLINLDLSHAGQTWDFQVQSFQGSNTVPTSTCTGEIVVAPVVNPPCSAVQNTPWVLNVPKDFRPSDPQLDSLKVSWASNISLDPFFSFSYFDTPIDNDCVPGPEYTERKWTMLNWCETPPLSTNTVPRLDRNADGKSGDAYLAMTIGDSLVVFQNNPPFPVCQKDGGIFEYVQRIYLTDSVLHTISGKVFHDANANCTSETSENALVGWTVVAVSQPSGTVQKTETDAFGNYEFAISVCDITVEISLDLPYNYGGTTCQTTYFSGFSSVTQSENLTQNIGAQLDDECPLMVVDLESPKIRPCFPGFYTVSFANVSDQTIENTYAEVLLDDKLDFVSASIPHTDLGGGKYSFQLGDLDAGQAGQFQINFFTQCDATPGATHCTEAHIFPDTLCPDSPLWFGANIEVSGSCVADTVYFEIKNTGSGASQTLDFVIVEDVIMREMGTFNLAPGGIFHPAPIPADGSTFRLEAEQEPGHPYGGMPAVAIEGCNGFTQGMVLQFPIGNANPFIELVCQENVNSFDPNEKEASPRGYGSEHKIEPATELDYTVHFQNTGTDTAFRVVILDTLSQNLDAASVRALSGSHPFRFEKLPPGNVLRFTFDDINLPDSTTNYVGSQGFVKFHVPQKSGNPIGTLIENRAAIYFDFNAPIFTGTVFHTVDTHFVQVVSVKNLAGISELNVYPNPGREFVFFNFEKNSNPSVVPNDVQFTLTDLQGKTVRTENFNTIPFRFERKGLAEGIYFFRIESAQMGGLFAGKVVFK